MYSFTVCILWLHNCSIYFGQDCMLSFREKKIHSPPDLDYLSALVLFVPTQKGDNFILKGDKNLGGKNIFLLCSIESLLVHMTCQMSRPGCLTLCDTRQMNLAVSRVGRVWTMEQGFRGLLDFNENSPRLSLATSIIECCFVLEINGEQWGMLPCCAQIGPLYFSVLYLYKSLVGDSFMCSFIRCVLRI